MLFSNIMKCDYDYDLIILIISSRGSIYDQLIKLYWLPFIDYIERNSFKIKVFFIFGNNVDLGDLNIKKDNLIVSNYPENLIPGITLKTVYSFNIVNNNYKYKHIFRTNLSSFLILDNLIEQSNKLPSIDVYAAIFGKTKQNIEFGSGSGYWLSKDNVEFILSNRDKLDLTLIDDVCIAILLQKKNKTYLTRYDIDKNINISDKLELLQEITMKNFYHIRIKNKNRNLDIEYFKEFVKIYL